MKIWVPKLYRAALRLMSPLATDETYKIILEEACDLTESPYGSLFLYRHKNLERVYSTVPLEKQVEPRKNGYAYKAYRSHQIICVPIKEMRKIHAHHPDKSIRQIILVPLTHEGISWGVLSLESSKGRRLPDKKIQLLQLFGSLVSLKIRNNDLINEMQAAIQTRDLFISMASHELKTPMTTILATSQLLARKVTSSDSTVARSIEKLQQASKRMSRLINELLHINQVRNGVLTIDTRSICAAHFVAEALNEVKSNYPQHTFLSEGLEIAKRVQIECDADKLTQVLINLLNNAAKFSSENKAIKLQVTCDDSSLICAITDQGSGISRKDIKHLFEEFYKAQGNNREGLGLGLFISKRIVEAHRGTISVESKLGKGTTMKVTLPYASCEPEN